MANSVSHASLPFPIKGARYTVILPYLDADGDPTDPTTPDTERSIDGAAFADCTEEATTITGSNGMAYITLTGDETNCSMLAVAAKVASGPKNTLLTLYPRLLPPFATGTAQAGAAGSITLAAGSSSIPNFYIGMIVKTTGGTGGGGGSGSLGNQARRITDYNSSTKAATVEPDWETTPDNTTTYALLGTAEWIFRHADVEGWLAAVAPANSGDAFARLGAPAGASVSADIAAIEAQTDDIGAAGAGLSAIPWNAAWDAEVQSEVADALGVYDPPTHTELIAEIDAVQTDVAGVQSDTNDIQTRLPAALVGGRIDANVGAISGDATAADNLESYTDGTTAMPVDVTEIAGDPDGATNLDRSTRAIVLGVVDAGSSTTSIVTASLDPAAAAADQFKGRIVIFDKDTTTANLRGQATDITANTSGGVLTVTALTDAPASGDTFSIT